MVKNKTLVYATRDLINFDLIYSFLIFYSYFVLKSLP